jgi:membrane protein implicated in regulation of membrane protease activity
MTNTTPSHTQAETTEQTERFVMGAVIGIVSLTIILLAGAVVLGIFAEQTAPIVEVIRDFLIVLLALELVIIAAAVVVFVVQLARFINLLNNEIQPIVTSAQDTVNTVRGTAVFLSKNVTEPVIQASSVLRAVTRTIRDLDAVRKAAGIAMAAASSPAPADDEPPSAPAPD